MPDLGQDICETLPFIVKRTLNPPIELNRVAIVTTEATGPDENEFGLLKKQLHFKDA